MNVYTKTKVLFKFGSLKIMCVEMRSKKAIKKNANEPIHVKFRCTHMKMILRQTHCPGGTDREIYR